MYVLVRDVCIREVTVLKKLWLIHMSYDFLVKCFFYNLNNINCVCLVAS